MQESAYLHHHPLLQHILGCYLNNIVCTEPPRPVLVDTDESRSVIWKGCESNTHRKEKEIYKHLSRLICYHGDIIH